MVIDAPQLSHGCRKVRTPVCNPKLDDRWRRYSELVSIRCLLWKCGMLAILTSWHLAM
jgi:hypothetical protein